MHAIWNCVGLPRAAGGASAPARARPARPGGRHWRKRPGSRGGGDEGERGGAVGGGKGLVCPPRGVVGGFFFGGGPQPGAPATRRCSPAYQPTWTASLVAVGTIRWLPVSRHAMRLGPTASAM